MSRSSHVMRQESCKVGIFPGMSAQRGELCRPGGAVPLCASVSRSLKQRGNLPVGEVGDSGCPSPGLCLCSSATVAGRGCGGLGGPAPLQSRHSRWGDPAARSRACPSLEAGLLSSRPAAQMPGRGFLGTSLPRSRVPLGSDWA